MEVTQVPSESFLCHNLTLSESHSSRPLRSFTCVAPSHLSFSWSLGACRHQAEKLDPGPSDKCFLRARGGTQRSSEQYFCLPARNSWNTTEGDATWTPAAKYTVSTHTYPLSLSFSPSFFLSLSPSFFHTHTNINRQTYTYYKLFTSYQSHTKTVTHTHIQTHNPKRHVLTQSHT